jgi:holliday junction DNA helicase RuvA
MIARVTGRLEELALDNAFITVGAWQIALLISEETRMRLQSKLNEEITLYTIFDIEGGVGGSRMSPRLIGFRTPLDREFFEIFTSVDGVGVRKALRAMTRPVDDLARMIQNQDVKGLSTLPGIGEAFAERIVAKLRRKVTRFALQTGSLQMGGTSSKSEMTGLNISPEVFDDAFQVLLSFGHSDLHARNMIETVLSQNQTFDNATDLLAAVYQTESKPAKSTKSAKQPRTRKQ